MPESKDANKELSMDDLKDVSGGLHDSVHCFQGKDQEKESFSELSDISRNFKEKNKKKENRIGNPYQSPID
jgi:hypothetical protein